MKNGWQIVPMGQLCSIKSGKSDTKDAVEDGAYAFFDRSKTIKKSSRYLYNCEALIIPGEGTEFLPKHFVGKFDLHQRAYALFDFTDLIDVKYLYHYLHHLCDYFPSVAVGATVKSLRMRHFEQLPVSLTNLPEQQRIVGILDAAFAGIATAKAHAEKNLQNARALFESHLNAIFTQRGEGWVEKTLVEATDLITCGVAKRPEYVSAGVPFLSAKNVKGGQVIWDGYKYVSEETHQALTKNNKPNLGDILYTRVGSYGEAAIIDREMEFSIFVSLTLIKPKPNLLNTFLKHYLNSSKVKELAASSINGVGVGNLNVGTVRQFPIHLPPLTEQHSIVAKLDNLQANTQRLESIYQRKLAALDELKKSLLHQAFSGELTADHEQADRTLAEAGV